MTIQEFWLPYTISQIVFLFLLIASWRWFRAARLLVVVSHDRYFLYQVAETL